MSDRKRAKTETITLRVDPKTKFMIEFLGRLDSQSLTAVVDTAIRDRADTRGIESYCEYEKEKVTRRWSDFWDPSDGVRLLRLLAESQYKSNFEEDEVRQFTLNHWPFFYADSRGDSPKRGFVDIIWPHMDQVISIWRETKSKDYWAAGNKMKSILSSAGVTPPRNWPPKTESQATATKQDDLDDDIPF